MSAGGDNGLASLALVGVAPFRGGARGAYTIMHDDLCDYTTDSLFDIAKPELDKKGLVAAFGVIVQRCQERMLWNRVNDLARSGHEIMNHSWLHEDIGMGADLATEIDAAAAVLDDSLDGAPARFFIFPYDSFNDNALRRLQDLGYLGARAGERGLNEADFGDPLRIKFDVYGGEYSIYASSGDVLKHYVDLAISNGGWAVREFHGIEDATFQPVPQRDYVAHLDYVRQRIDAGELWLDSPSNVIRYRLARLYCGPPSLVGATITFAAADPRCTERGLLLTVLIKAGPQVTAVSVVQADTIRQGKQLSVGQYALDIDPSAGDAVVVAE